MRNKHEIKSCPRCGANFECRANNPARCDCAGVALTPELLERIGESYSDCLCAGCLEALRAADAADP